MGTRKREPSGAAKTMEKLFRSSAVSVFIHHFQSAGLDALAIWGGGVTWSTVITLRLWGMMALKIGVRLVALPFFLTSRAPFPILLPP
jgi:hypothetical protein